jgi:hypothetical protein
VTIHASDPFATPDDQRSLVRRLRGRLPAPVTLWTAGQGAARAGLTVSSMLVADGDPGRVLGIIDEESELWTSISETGRFAITLLHQGDHLIAERFAGLLPSPGGLFSAGSGGAGPAGAIEWRDTGYGPVPRTVSTWSGVRLDASRTFGWGLLIEATIDTVALAEEGAAPVVHVRGRYRDVTI